MTQLAPALNATPRDVTRPWLPPQPSHSIIFTHCKIVDPVSGSLLDNRAIKIHGNKIVWVKAMDEVASTALNDPEARVFDLEGQIVSPGLIDSHVRLQYSASSWFDR
jgi:adenine deaminase